MSVAIVGRQARVFVSQQYSLVERFVKVFAKDMALPNELIVGKECLRVEVIVVGIRCTTYAQVV